MDAILNALNTFEQSKVFTECRPWVLAASVWAPLLVAGMAIGRDELLCMLRQSIDRAGLSEKALAIELGFSQGLLSLRLNGARPLSLDVFALMPVEVLRWFAVAIAERYGVPAPVEAGARLQRRQARMAIATAKRAAVRA